MGDNELELETINARDLSSNAEINSESFEIQPKSNWVIGLIILFLLYAGVWYFSITFLELSLIYIILIFAATMGILIVVSVFYSKKSRDKDLPEEVRSKLEVFRAKEAMRQAQARDLETQIHTLEEQIKNFQAEIRSVIEEKHETIDARRKALLIAPVQDMQRLLKGLQQQKTAVQRYMTQLQIETKRRAQLETRIGAIEEEVLSEEQLEREVQHKIQLEMEQLQRELEQVSSQFRARMQNEMQDFESQWELKKQQLETTRREELQKLEKQLAEEENRREVLEQKRKLEAARILLQNQLKQKQFGDIEKAKSHLTEILGILRSWYKRFEAIQDVSYIRFLDRLTSNVSRCLLDLDRHRDNIKTKYFLINSLNMLNAQLQKLRDSVGLQRAAPVLTTSAEPRLTVFSRISQMNFLCECCLSPVEEITIKEHRRWIHWGLMGLKVMVNFAIARGISTMGSLVSRLLYLGAVDNLADNVSRIIDNSIANSSNALGKLWSEYLEKGGTFAQLEEFQEVSGAMRPIKDQIGNDADSICNAIRLTHVYFQRKVKQDTLEEAMKYLEDREKTVWQWFSHNEQEEIRKMLKDTGNTHIYTSVLTLRNGLYICQDCNKWLDQLENYQPLFATESND